jgi:hypothetical protein
MAAIEVKRKTAMISKWWQAAMVFDNFLFSASLIHFFDTSDYSESLWKNCLEFWKRQSVWYDTSDIDREKQHATATIETIMFFEDRYKLAL